MKKNNTFKIVFLSVLVILVCVLLTVLFTAKTVEIKYNSLGGVFEGEDYVLLNPYDEQAVDTVSVNAYNQVSTVKVRSNSVLSMPEPTREGYTFDGWYIAAIDAESGNVTYVEQFDDKYLRNNEVGDTIAVYAKWKLVETSQQKNGLFSKLDKGSVIGALNIMWKGMLGIFLVLGIIFVCIVVLNTLTNPDKRAKLFGARKSDGTNENKNQQ